MLAARAAAFRKLDTDHNNLLSFEEWAIKTSDRFKGADANRDGTLSRDEFATTRPKRPNKPKCDCAPTQRRHAAEPVDPESGEDGTDPGA